MPPGSPALSLTGTERQALMTPTEASNTTVVCLNRNGGGEEQVGPVFAVRPALTYALSSDAVTGVPFDVAVTGIATFDALDEVRLHRDTCAGGPVSGTDRVRRSASEVRVTFTAAEAHAAVAVCITRRCAKCVGGRTPAAEVGTPFRVAVPFRNSSSATLQYTLYPTDVVQHIQFVAVVTGDTDFDSNDTITFRTDTCAGILLSAVPQTHSCTGTDGRNLCPRGLGVRCGRGALIAPKRRRPRLRSRGMYDLPRVEGATGGRRGEDTRCNAGVIAPPSPADSVAGAGG